MTVPFAFIIINIFNTFKYYLYYYQNALQTPPQNTEITQRLHSVHAARPQRAHGAVEERPHSTLSNTLCKRQAAACFCTSSQRSKAFPWRCWRFHSAHLGDQHLLNALKSL